MLTGAAVLVAVAATGAVVVLSGGEQATAAAQAASANTAPVQKGKLSAAVSQDGTLTYRARPDGSPFSAINHARGTYTELPAAGDKVGCGDVLYRVDDQAGAAAVRHGPGLPRAARGRCRSGRPSAQPQPARARRRRRLHHRRRKTRSKALQRRKGVHVTGALALGDAVFLPEAVRIAKVTGQLGGSARPGAQALSATSDTLHVQVNLDPSEQGQVKRGDRAQITLPGNTTVTGKVDGFGRVAEAPAGQGGSAADATIPTYISLDDPGKARGLDKAPVGVDITTAGVDERAERPGHRAGRQVRRRVRGRGGARRRATRAGRGDAWACSTPPTGASRSRATCAKAIAVAVPSL